MKTALQNGRIITPEGILENKTLLLEDGVILGLEEPNVKLPSDTKLLDCSGAYVSPGFLDLHLHGGGGHDYMDGTVEAIEEASRTHLKHGTTSLCPTTLTSTDEDLFSFFEMYRTAKEDMQDGPELLGIHLEGPYFSPEQRGAQDPKYLRKPTKEHWTSILSSSPDIVRMSLAPELEGALELGRELEKRGIVAAIGHSNANYKECRKAVEAGFRHVTHLYSGMSTIHRKNAYRVLGVVESAYLLDELSVEIIADGCHLPPELLEYIVRFKDSSKISLITDSSRGATMPEGSKILLGSLKNGQECYVENGVAIMPDRTCFAGSVCTTDRCVRTMWKKVGVSLETAVSMMSYHPAKVLGLEKHKGLLQKGYDADIVVFDDYVNILHALGGGLIRF